MTWLIICYFVVFFLGFSFSFGKHVYLTGLNGIDVTCDRFSRCDCYRGSKFCWSVLYKLVIRYLMWPLSMPINVLFEAGKNQKMKLEEKEKLERQILEEEKEADKYIEAHKR